MCCPHVLPWQEFFRRLKEEGSTEHEWYQGIKGQMKRMIAQRMIRLGENFDNSAQEIFGDEINDVCKAFAQADTFEAAERKFSIKTLWRAGGRASEPGAMSLNSLRWNRLHSAASIESPQSKPSKMKWVIFLAGVNRHADWMLDLGDYLCFLSRESDQHKNLVYPSDETAWLVPELQGDHSGTKISNYLKGITRGGLQKYAHVAVTSLPPHPTAAGVRPGAADTLARAVPAELAVHNTGHDLTGLSALWEYLNARCSLLVPGALVLAGWPALPYGQMGQGPKSPNLSALTDCVSMEDLEKFIDSLFYLCDQTLPSLRVGGDLRPLLHAATATMIMYYPQRFEAPQEMPKVLQFMRSAYGTMGAVGTNAHFELCSWSKKIMAQFNADNLRLTAKMDHSGIEQLVHAVQQLGSAIATMHTRQADIAIRQIRTEDKLDQLIALISSGAVRAVGGDVALAPLAQPSPAVVAAMMDAPPPPNTAPPRPRVAPGSAPMVHSSTTPEGDLPGDYEAAGKTSGRLFQDTMKAGYKVPIFKNDERGKRRSDATTVAKAYYAMATAEDRNLLLNYKQSDEQEASKRISQLTKLLVQRIKEAYVAKGEDPPKRFGQGIIMINTMVDNLRKSGLVVCANAFATWRAQPRGSSQGSSNSAPMAMRAASNAPDKVSSPRKSPREPARPAYAEGDGSGSSDEGEDEGATPGDAIMLASSEEVESEEEESEADEDGDSDGEEGDSNE